MNLSSLVINLQNEALLTLTVDLLVHNLNVLKAASVRILFVYNWDGELVFESLQVQLLWSDLSQFSQGPVLTILFLNTHVAFFVDKIFLQ